MSQAKNTRSKHKLLPTEFSVSLKTPKSKQYLFPTDPISGDKKGVNMFETEGNNVKKTKRKKLRRTQNHLNISGESNEESSSSCLSLRKTKKSAHSGDDGDISSEQSEKAVKTKRKRVKLPAVNLNDFGSLEDVLQSSSQNDSTDVFHETTSRKKTKKKAKSKNLDKEENEIKSTRKNRKTETSENKENFINDGSAVEGRKEIKKRRRNKKIDSIDDIEESDKVCEKTDKKTTHESEVSEEADAQDIKLINPRKTRKRRRGNDSENIEKICNSELTDLKISEDVSAKNLKSSINVNKCGKSSIAHSDITDETDGQEKKLSSKSRKKKRLNKSRESESLETDPTDVQNLPDIKVKDSEPSKKNRRKLISEHDAEISGTLNRQKLYSEYEISHLKDLDSPTLIENAEKPNMHVSSIRKTRTSQKNDQTLTAVRNETTEVEENLKVSNTRKSRTSQKNDQTPTAVRNETTEVEENLQVSNTGKSRTPRKSGATRTAKTTDVYANVENNIQSSECEHQGESFRKSRGNFKTLCIDENDITRRSGGVVRPRKTWRTSLSENFQQCGGTSAMDSGAQILENPNGDSSKLFSDGRMSVKGENKRKRWTILQDEGVEITASNGTKEENETSSSVNQSRRSTRKRWSSELRKNILNGFKIEDGIASPAATGVSSEDSSKVHCTPKRARCSDTSGISATSTKYNNSIEHNSTFIQKQSCISSGDDEKENFSAMEDCNDCFTPEQPLRGKFKRYSKSLDCLEGIKPLESSMLDIEEEPLNEPQVKHGFNRKPSTPGAVLKRRGTYDVDVSITDVSILKSLSEGNLSASTNEDKPVRTEKSVKFQHVTRRKPQVHRDDYSVPCESKKQESIIKKENPKLAAVNKSVSFDHTMFSASSCSTSTPLHHASKKDNLLKQTLKNNLNNGSNKRRSKSLENKREKPVSKIRMPNFAKIHQRWNDKLEDISEMAARKAERARLLLSGQKPQATSYHNESQNKSKSDKNKHPKHLDFGGQPSTSGVKGTFQSSLGNIKEKRTQIPTKILDNSKKQAAIDQNTIGKTNPANSRNFMARSGIPKKLEIKKPSKEEIKSLVTKTKPKQDYKDERRTILKGVRGNRRFELLMKMRNKS